MEEPSLSVLQQIDQICEEFEACLCSASAVRVEDFCRRLPPPDSWWLLTALIDIDLHHYWSNNDRRLVIDASGQTASMESYLRRFPELLAPAGSDALRHAMRSEFQIRQELGDQPRMDDVLLQVPGQHEGLRSVFHEVLHDLSPLVVKLYDARHLRCEVPLRRRLEIGRRRHDDAPVASVMPLDDCDRLVIAEAAETKVARQHADCEQVARNCVVVRNHSHKSSVCVNRIHRVLPQGTWSGPPPLLLHVGTKILRVESHD